MLNFGQKNSPPMVRQNNQKSALKRVAMRFLGKKEITFAWYTNVISYVVAELGFEPRQTESESVVLPLHNSALFG